MFTLVLISLALANDHQAKKNFMAKIRADDALEEALKAAAVKNYQEKMAKQDWMAEMRANEAFEEAMEAAAAKDLQQKMAKQDWMAEIREEDKRDRSFADRLGRMSQALPNRAKEGRMHNLGSSLYGSDSSSDDDRLADNIDLAKHSALRHPASKVASKDMSKCQMEARRAELMAQAYVGFTGHQGAPDCDENGDYKALQCHGSTGYCWCVDTLTGEKIEEKGEAPPGSDLDCGRPNVERLDTAQRSVFSPEAHSRTVLTPTARAQDDGLAPDSVLQECPAYMRAAGFKDAHGVEVTFTAGRCERSYIHYPDYTGHVRNDVDAQLLDQHGDPALAAKHQCAEECEAVVFANGGHECTGFSYVPYGIRPQNDLGECVICWGQVAVAPLTSISTTTTCLKPGNDPQSRGIDRTIVSSGARDQMPLRELEEPSKATARGYRGQLFGRETSFDREFRAALERKPKEKAQSCSEYCQSGGHGNGSIIGTSPICKGDCEECQGWCTIGGSGVFSDYGVGCWLGGHKVCCCSKE